MRAARAEEAGDGSGGAPGPSGAAPEELVPAEVSPELVKRMEEMGFSAVRATRALYLTGGESMEAAVGWLEDHQADADLDEPLMVPKVPCCVAGLGRAGQGRAGQGRAGQGRGGMAQLAVERCAGRRPRTQLSLLPH